MTHLYHVYTITFNKPDLKPSDPVTPNEGILLAPAYISSPNSGQIYMIQYHGCRDIPNPNTVMPKHRIPGVFGNCPVDTVQTDLYKSTQFFISKLELIGVSNDMLSFCRTAKTIAKYNIGTTQEARLTWLKDTLEMVTNQGVYKSMEKYNAELKQEDLRKFNRRLKGMSRRVCSPPMNQTMSPPVKT